MAGSRCSPTPHLLEQVVAEVGHELSGRGARHILVAEALKRLLERLERGGGRASNICNAGYACQRKCEVLLTHAVMMCRSIYPDPDPHTLLTHPVEERRVAEARRDVGQELVVQLDDGAHKLLLVRGRAARRRFLGGALAWGGEGEGGRG